MYISPYTALDAAVAVAASEKPVTDKLGSDERATVIDLLSQKNQALTHETDQIFILGYN
ncbi:hypothetical protein [Pseudoalteromonas sp. Ld20]|uniref:hypothetical protein n=1 Tax=Pseudoalteromonas sp. Ld20 TaxID=649165 RepID=UPI00386C0935